MKQFPTSTLRIVHFAQEVYVLLGSSHCFGGSAVPSAAGARDHSGLKKTEDQSNRLRGDGVVITVED